MTKSPQFKSPEQINDLFCLGNAEELWKYMHYIENHPEQVIVFENSYDNYYFEGGAEIQWPKSTDHDLFLSDICKKVNHMHKLIRKPDHLGKETYLAFINYGGGEISVEFGLMDSKEGRCQWDLWQGNAKNSVFAFVEIAFNCTYRDYQCLPKPGHKSSLATVRPD